MIAVREIAMPDILADVERSLRAEARLIPHQSNWASTLMDPCERRLVYQRIDWDKAKPPDPRLQGIFETGKRIEKLVLNILNEIGADASPMWELLKPTSRAKDNLLTRYRIDGIPDCFLRVLPKEGPRSACSRTTRLSRSESRTSASPPHGTKPISKKSWSETDLWCNHPQVVQCIARLKQPSIDYDPIGEADQPPR
jgi:hypothetical protein